MNATSIVRVLSCAGLLLSGLMILCGLTGFIRQETSAAISLLASGTITATTSGAMLALTGKPTKRSRPPDALATAVLFWFLAPFVCAAPFLSIEGAGFIAALHEATSCLTTTGHSVLTLDQGDMPGSIMFWRTCLHAVGAIATVTIAATVLAALNLDGPGIHRTLLFSLPDGSFFDRMPRVARTVAAIFGVSVSSVALLSVVGGTSLDVAIMDSVSALSTGLVNPFDIGFEPIGLVRAAAMSIGLVLGSVGLYVLLLVGDRPFAALRDPETLTFGVVFVFAALLAMSLGVSVPNAMGWSLSALSTSGVQLWSGSEVAGLPLTVLALPALVGGSALSAAGGIKLARMFVLSKRVGQEFLQLGYRGSVLKFQFRDREQTEKTILGIWVYLAAYIIATAIGTLIYAFFEASFDDSIRMTIGALTNYAGLMDVEFLRNHKGAQLFTVLGMILGRLEVLALIPVLSIQFWRR